MFKPLEGEQCILVNKGTHRVCDLYVRPDGGLYAKIGSGYVRLKANGYASNDHALEAVELKSSSISQDSYGKLHAIEETPAVVLAKLKPTTDERLAIATTPLEERS